MTRKPLAAHPTCAPRSRHVALHGAATYSPHSNPRPSPRIRPRPPPCVRPARFVTRPLVPLQPRSVCTCVRPVRLGSPARIHSPDSGLTRFNWPAHLVVAWCDFEPVQYQTLVVGSVHGFLGRFSIFLKVFKLVWIFWDLWCTSLNYYCNNLVFSLV